MKILNIIAKDAISTLVVIEIEDTKGIAKVDNTTGEVLKIWKLSEEGIQYCIENYLYNVH